MDAPQHPRLHLLSLPSEIRSQIFNYCITTTPLLTFCPCLSTSPRPTPYILCNCHKPLEASSSTSSDVQTTLLQPPSSLHSPLPLVCRFIYVETTSALLKQPRKTVVVCSPKCLTALLSRCNYQQLSVIDAVRIDVDLRVFRQKPGELPSFREIWDCLYYTSRDLSRTAAAFFSRSKLRNLDPSVIEPELDFYKLWVDGLRFPTAKGKRCWSGVKVTDPGKINRLILKSTVGHGLNNCMFWEDKMRARETAASLAVEEATERAITAPIPPAGGPMREPTYGRGQKDAWNETVVNGGL